MMNKLKLAFLLATPLLLAACQTAKPITSVVDAQPTVKNVKHGDVLASQRAAGQDIPELRGHSYVTVRTSAVTIDKQSGRQKNEEIEGVACTISSEGYRASVKSAAQVKVPNYGYASRPIKAECKAPGYKDGIQVVAPYDETSQKRMSRAGSGGLLGVLVVGIIDAATSNKNHIFSYPSINVLMRKN